MNGAARIAAERDRQITQEGYTPEHDENHLTGDLAAAAACYSLFAHWQLSRMPLPDGPPPGWPFDDSWWKPSDPARNLEKAGALAAAEIDRLEWISSSDTRVAADAR